ncbi:serpin I2-like [Amphibalanus amphitrite]|uniref:serpin I2-like n=1 Tax=Amphibalanus amphitrite TaxID=1232801 RepID=UPI001C90BB3B|nr:serpin I2-like [Amphibalanus amphitrite]XP_043196695.1 serpin I2-like [Amphibalanus amphitrite]
MPASVGPGPGIILCLLSGSCLFDTTTGSLPTRSDMALLQKMVTDQPLANHVTSPFLMSMLMSQVWLGARGSTRNEMSTTLGMSSQHMAAYKSALQQLGNAKTGVTTSVFNRIYHLSSFSVKPSYTGLLLNYFGSRPKVLPRDTVAAAKEINDLASEKTQGNIKDLVTPKDLENVVMVLFGAIYFKGTWLYRFKTADKMNFLTPNGERAVTMMELKTEVLAGYFRDYQAVALPYKDQDYSLIVVQPHQRTLAAVKGLQSALSSLDIGKIYGQLRKREQTVIMPRFKVEAKYKMPQYYIELGIKKIFKSSADFSGMSRERIYVKDIIQKAMIEVNEEGTTAAAAGVVLMTKSASLPFIVNRPFFAFVYHKKLKSVLFAAHVNDPS